MRSRIHVLLTALCLVPAALSAVHLPTAHQPRYDDRRLWPDLTGKERFVQQRWEPARVFVWAHPGVDGKDERSRRKDVERGRDPGPDPLDPASWLVGGRPATSMPGRDELADIVLPPADRPYRVLMKDARFRHVTVGRNAFLNVGRCQTWGNLWIHEGGAVYDDHRLGRGTDFEGPYHTFIRNDNRASVTGRRGQNPTEIAYWAIIAKRQGASIEFIGHVNVGDEFKFNEGHAVIGPGTVTTTGPASVNIIGPEAIVELQSGAIYGKRQQRDDWHDTLVKGQLWAGSPERPLTENATLLLNIKRERPGAGGFDLAANARHARKHTWGVNRYVTPFAESKQLDWYGFTLVPGAALRVHSADPQNARLVFTWNGEGDRRPGTGVRALLLGEVDPRGLAFDGFEPGGIRIAPDADPAAWIAGAIFGPNNAASPQETVTRFAGR